MKKIAAGFALALSFALAATAFAGEPVHKEIPYSKKVSLYAPRTYTFHFSIYDAASFGSEHWFEEKPLRLTSKTLYYALGSDKTFEEGVFGPLDFSEQYWIQVSYWTGKAWKVLGTRDKLAASPYALWGVNPGPQGEQGIQGIQGEPGAKGDPGTGPVNQSCPDGQCVKGFSSNGSLICTPCAPPAPPNGIEQCGTFNGHIYYCSTATKTWDVAKSLCESFSAYLAVIFDQAENDAINGFITTTHGGASEADSMIGLYEKGDIEGNWYWVNNIPLSGYSYWGEGGPNNVGGVENVAEMVPLWGGQWNDCNGGEPNHFVCEKD